MVNPLISTEASQTSTIHSNNSLSFPTKQSARSNNNNQTIGDNEEIYTIAFLLAGLCFMTFTLFIFYTCCQLLFRQPNDKLCSCLRVRQLRQLGQQTYRGTCLQLPNLRRQSTVRSSIAGKVWDAPSWRKVSEKTECHNKDQKANYRTAIPDIIEELTNDHPNYNKSPWESVNLNSINSGSNLPEPRTLGYHPNVVADGGKYFLKIPTQPDYDVFMATPYRKTSYPILHIHDSHLNQTNNDLDVKFRSERRRGSAIPNMIPTISIDSRRHSFNIATCLFTKSESPKKQKRHSMQPPSSNDSAQKTSSMLHRAVNFYKEHNPNVIKKWLTTNSNGLLSNHNRYVMRKYTWQNKLKFLSSKKFNIRDHPYNNASCCFEDISKNSKNPFKGPNVASGEDDLYFGININNSSPDLTASISQLQEHVNFYNAHAFKSYSSEPLLAVSS